MFFLLIPCRGCCYQPTEQEVLPYGVLHSSKEQHEGDPCLLHPHLPAVPLLCSPAPNVALLPRRSRRSRTAPRPAHLPSNTTFLDLQCQQPHRPLRAGEILARRCPGGEQPPNKPRPEPDLQPCIHTECLLLAHPPHRSIFRNGPIFVPLSHVTADWAHYLPLPPDTAKQRLWQLLLRARGLSV